MFDDTPKIVKVELLDPALKQTYGAVMHVEEAKALLGESKGKWRIIRDVKVETYVDKMMTAEPKTSPLTMRDLRGETYETKNVKKKKVAWVMDHSRSGGAEMTSSETVRVGLLCGFNIDVVSPSVDPKLVRKIMSEAEVAVLNNLFEFPPDLMRIVMERIAIDRLPYVKFEHDHRELDRPEFSRRLFANSRLNVFLSPAHLKNHQERLGCQGVCLPLAIDPAPFMAEQNVAREPGTALVCNVRHFKTWGNLQRYVKENPGTRFTVLAPHPVIEGDNVETRPMVPFNEMPKTYAAHEVLVHLLDGWGAGERVVFEAALSGCKIVANEKVGHLSWEIDLTDRVRLAETLTEAPYEFWRRVEAVA